jgi:hypothetical protein
MPESYITAAENKIKADTAAYLEENSVPRVVYGLKPDEKYIRDNGIKLRVGDRITLIDRKLPINASLRIATMSYALVNEADIEVSISNFIPYTLQDRLVATAIDTKKDVQQLYRGNAELGRRNSLNLFALRDLIIDPEGNYFTDKIKPGSIETLYFSNGAKSTNFALKNVAFTPNSGGDASKFTATAGQLVHFSIKIEGVGFVWEMQSLTVTGLLPAVTYYLYDRVSRTSVVGSWILSTEVLTVESEVDHFILQTGVIYPVLDGYRNYDLTKGMVFIIGDQITAGKLKSIDGLNFFDMTDGKFNMGDAKSGIDWNVSSEGALTIRGALASDIIQVGSEGSVNSGISGLKRVNQEDPVRFWAGANVATKNSAPFRVLDSGKVFASNLKLGYGTRSYPDPNEPGKEITVAVEGWNIGPFGIISDPINGTDPNIALIRGSDINGNEFSFGTELMPSSTGGAFSMTGRLKNTRAELGTVPGLDDTTNIALNLRASGANKNIALQISSGDVDFGSGNITVSGSKGITGKFGYTADNRAYQMTFYRGILVSQGPW